MKRPQRNAIRIKFVNSVQESIALNNIKSHAIIIAGKRHVRRRKDQASPKA